MLGSYYLGQVGPFQGLLSGPSLFFFQNVFPTITKNKIGGSTQFLKQKSCAQKFQGLLSGPTWPFLCCNKLGPCLAQIINPQKVLFAFFASRYVRKSLFLQNGQETLHISQNTGYQKIPCCCNPHRHQQLVFYKLSFLKDKTFMLTKTTTYDKEQTKIRNWD